MPTYRRVLAAPVLAALLAATAPVGPASAGTPTTQPDRVGVLTPPASVGGRATVTVDVLANDTAPEGETLALCGVTVPPADPDGPEDPGYRASIADGLIRLVVSPAAPKIFAVGYTACAGTGTDTGTDTDTGTGQATGTLTVDVTRAKRVTVAVTRRPGVLRVTNPNPVRVRLIRGHFGPSSLNGVVRVPAHGSRTFRVHTTRIEWMAFVRSTGLLVGVGLVRGITLPRS